MVTPGDGVVDKSDIAHHGDGALDTLALIPTGAAEEAENDEVGAVGVVISPGACTGENLTDMDMSGDTDAVDAVSYPSQKAGYVTSLGQTIGEVTSPGQTIEEVTSPSQTIGEVASLGQTIVEVTSPGQTIGEVTSPCETAAGVISPSQNDRSSPQKRPRPSVKPRPVPAKRKSLEKVMSVDISTVDTAVFDIDKSMETLNTVPSGGDKAELESANGEMVAELVGSVVQFTSDNITLDTSQPSSNINHALQDEPDGQLKTEPTPPARPNKFRKSMLNKFESVEATRHSPEIPRKKQSKDSLKNSSSTSGNNKSKLSNENMKDSPKSSRKKSPKVPKKKLSVPSNQQAESKTDDASSDKTKAGGSRPKSVVIRPAPPPPKVKPKHTDNSTLPETSTVKPDKDSDPKTGKPDKDSDPKTVKPDKDSDPKTGKPSKDNDLETGKLDTNSDSVQVKKIAANMSDMISKGLKHQISCKDKPRPPPKPKPSMTSQMPTSVREGEKEEQEEGLFSEQGNKVARKESMKRRNHSYEAALGDPVDGAETKTDQVESTADDVDSHTDDEKSKRKFGAGMIKVFPFVKPKPRRKSDTVVKPAPDERPKPKNRPRRKTMDDIIDTKKDSEKRGSVCVEGEMHNGVNRNDPSECTEEEVEIGRVGMLGMRTSELTRWDSGRKNMPTFVAPPPPHCSRSEGEEVTIQSKTVQISSTYKSSSSTDESCDTCDDIAKDTLKEKNKNESDAADKPKRVPSRKAPPPPIVPKKISLSTAQSTNQQGELPAQTPTSPGPPMLKPLGRSKSQDKKNEKDQNKITVDHDKELPNLPPQPEDESLYDEEGYLAPISIKGASKDVHFNSDIYSYADCPEIFPGHDELKKERCSKASRSHSTVSAKNVAIAGEHIDIDGDVKRERRRSTGSGSVKSRTSISSIGSHLYEMIKSRSGSGKSEDMSEERDRHKEERMSQSVFYVGVDDEHQPETITSESVLSVPITSESSPSVPTPIEPIDPYDELEINEIESKKEVSRHKSQSIDMNIPVPVAPPRKRRNSKKLGVELSVAAEKLVMEENSDKDEEVNNNFEEHVYELPPYSESSSDSDSESDSESDDYIYPEAQNPELEMKIMAAKAAHAAQAALAAQAAQAAQNAPPSLPPRIQSSVASTPPPLPTKDVPQSNTNTPPVPHKNFDPSDVMDEDDSNDESTISEGLENEHNDIDEEKKCESSVPSENEYNEVEEKKHPSLVSTENEYSELGEEEVKRQSTASKENEYNELDDDDNRMSHEYSDVEDIGHLKGGDSINKRDTLVPGEDDENYYDDTLTYDSDHEATLRLESKPSQYISPEDFGITKSMRSPSMCSDISSGTNSIIKSASSSAFTSPDGASLWKSHSSSGLPGSGSDTSSERPISWASSDAGSDYINMSKTSRTDIYMNCPPQIETPSMLDQSVSSDSELEQEEKKQKQSEERARKFYNKLQVSHFYSLLGEFTLKKINTIMFHEIRVIVHSNLLIYIRLF